MGGCVVAGCSIPHLGCGVVGRPGFEPRLCISIDSGAASANVINIWNFSPSRLEKGRTTFATVRAEVGTV